MNPAISYRHVRCFLEVARRASVGQAAEALAKRGFQNLYDYAGGMSDWKQSGNPVEGAAIT